MHAKKLGFLAFHSILSFTKTIWRGIFALFKGMEYETLRQIFDAATSDRDCPCALSHRASDQNLVPEQVTPPPTHQIYLYCTSKSVFYGFTCIIPVNLYFTCIIPAFYLYYTIYIYIWIIPILYLHYTCVIHKLYLYYT